MSSVLKEEVSEPKETDDINSISKKFLQKVFEGKKSFLSTTRFLSTYALPWEGVEDIKDARVMLKVHKDQQKQTRSSTLQSLKAVAAQLRKNQSTQPKSAQQTHAQSTSNPAPEAVVRSPTLPQEPAVEANVPVVDLEEEASPPAANSSPDSGNTSASNTGIMRKIDEDKRKREAKRRQEAQQRKEREERDNLCQGKERQTAVVHLGVSEVGGKKFIDSIDIVLPMTRGMRFKVESLMPPLSESALKAAGYSDRGCDLWVRSVGCRMVNSIRESEAVDKVTKFFIDNQKDDRHRFFLSVLSCELAELLFALLKRHPTRWVVLRKILAGFVDLSNAVLTYSSGTKERIGFKWVPYAPDLLEQIYVLVRGRDINENDRNDWAMTMKRIQEEIDNRPK